MASLALSTIGIEMPADFDTGSYESIHRHVGANSQLNLNAWEHYAGAWNALAYRFRSCADSDLAFSNSLRQFGAAPPPLERYLQEQELFNFFVSGLASMESFCYGLFAIGSMLNAGGFPMQTARELRSISPESTARRYEDAFKTEQLTCVLQQFTRSADLRDWKELRNILAHRSAPGRVISLAVGNTGGLPPSVWKTGIPLDTSTTAGRRTWLAAMIQILLKEAKAFVATQFP